MELGPRSGSGSVTGDRARDAGLDDRDVRVGAGGEDRHALAVPAASPAHPRRRSPRPGSASGARRTAAGRPDGPERRTAATRCPGPCGPGAGDGRRRLPVLPHGPGVSWADPRVQRVRGDAPPRLLGGARRMRRHRMQRCTGRRGPALSPRPWRPRHPDALRLPCSRSGLWAPDPPSELPTADAGFGLVRPARAAERRACPARSWRRLLRLPRSDGAAPSGSFGSGWRGEPG